MDLNNFLVSGVIEEITEMSTIKNNKVIFRFRLRSLKIYNKYLYYDVTVLHTLAKLMHKKLKVGMYIVVQGEFSSKPNGQLVLVAKKFMSWQSMISTTKSGISLLKDNDGSDVVNLSKTTLLREIEHSKKRGTNF